MHRHLPIGIVLILLGVFVAARTWEVRPVVFHESGQVRLLGVDSWFHARHAEYSRDHFPQLLRSDPGARYPGHGRQQVSGLFNLAIGGAARLAGIARGRTLPVDPFAAWAPVFLAALAFLALFLIAARVADPWTGLGACLVFLLFPATALERSLLGFADQHVLEFLLALGTAGGLAIAVLREYEGRGSWAAGLGLALPFALLFYSWLGAPIYIAVVAVTVLGMMVTGLIAGDDLRPAGLACLRFFGAVVVVQLFVLLLLPEWVMALGRHTEWWVLGGLTTLAVAPLGYARLMPAGGNRHRILWATATVAVFGVVCWLFFTYTGKGRFFFNQLTSVRGNRVAEQGDILWIDLWNRFGVPGILAAVSVPLAAVASAVPGRRSARLILVFFGLSVFLIWLRTHDFDYAPPILIALMAALGGREIVVWVRGRLSDGRVLTISVCSALLVLFLIPFGTGRPFWASVTEAQRMVRHTDAWFDAMAWLRTRTPSPATTPTSAVSGTEAYADSYGIMTSWDDGNFVAHVGRRIPTLSRFPGKRDGLWLTATTETASFEPVCPSCRGEESVRYAVVTAELASELFVAKALAAGREPPLQVEGFWQFPGAQVPRYSFGPSYRESLVNRLVRHGGEGLERYRLVYASPQKAVIFTLYRPASTNIVLDWVPVDSEDGRRFLESVANTPVAPIDGGYLYDLAAVPQVMIFELDPPVGAEGN